MYCFSAAVEVRLVVLCNGEWEFTETILSSKHADHLDAINLPDADQQWNHLHHRYHEW